MVDTIVIGHLYNAHFLGAVAIGSTIFSFLSWGFVFLRMVTTGLTVQNLNNSKNTMILKQSLLLAIIISLIILFLQIPISQLSFLPIESSELVLNYTLIYFDIRIWSILAVLINFVLVGWLIGKQATKSALLIILVVTINNIILDIVFVTFLGMNVSGVALASVISEYMGLIIAIIVLKQHSIDLKSLLSRFDSSISIISRRVLRLHLDVFIRTLCIIFSFAFFTIQGAKYGDLVLAANSVVLDGFANATEVIAGKYIIRNNQKSLKQALLLINSLSVMVASLFSIGYFLFGEKIIILLTNIPDVVEVANKYLIWIIITPIFAVWPYLFDGLFIGTTRGTKMRNTMLFSTFICFLPAWYGLQYLGNHGLWMAFLIFLTARGVSQSLYLRQILQLG